RAFPAIGTDCANSVSDQRYPNAGIERPRFAGGAPRTGLSYAGHLDHCLFQRATTNARVRRRSDRVSQQAIRRAIAHRLSERRDEALRQPFQWINSQTKLMKIQSTNSCLFW